VKKAIAVATLCWLAASLAGLAVAGAQAWGCARHGGCVTVTRDALQEAIAATVGGCGAKQP
jgi:hypothetical protein